MSIGLVEQAREDTLYTPRPRRLNARVVSAWVVWAAIVRQRGSDRLALVGTAATCSSVHGLGDLGPA